MGHLVEVEFDNDIGAFVDEVAQRPALRTARRVIILYEDPEGEWRTDWMNVGAPQLALASVMLSKAALGDKVWVDSGDVSS